MKRGADARPRIHIQRGEVTGWTWQHQIGNHRPHGPYSTPGTALDMALQDHPTASAVIIMGPIPPFSETPK